jgi:hypothetical protein
MLEIRFFLQLESQFEGLLDESVFEKPDCAACDGSCAVQQLKIHPLDSANCDKYGRTKTAVPCISDSFNSIPTYEVTTVLYVST